MPHGEGRQAAPKQRHGLLRGVGWHGDRGVFASFKSAVEIEVDPSVNGLGCAGVVEDGDARGIGRVAHTQHGQRGDGVLVVDRAQRVVAGGRGTAGGDAFRIDRSAEAQGGREGLLGRRGRAAFVSHGRVAVVKDVDVKGEDHMHVVAPGRGIGLDCVLAGRRADDGYGEVRVDGGGEIREPGGRAVNHMALADEIASLAEVVVVRAADVGGVVLGRKIAGQGRDENIQPAARRALEIAAPRAGVQGRESAGGGAENEQAVGAGVEGDAADIVLRGSAEIGALETHAGAAIERDARDEDVEVAAGIGRLRATRGARQVGRGGVAGHVEKAVGRRDQPHRGVGAERALIGGAAEEGENAERRRHRGRIGQHADEQFRGARRAGRAIDRVDQRGVVCADEGRGGKDELRLVRRERNGGEILVVVAAHVGRPLRGRRGGRGAVAHDHAFEPERPAGVGRIRAEIGHRDLRHRDGRRHASAGVEAVVVHDGHAVERIHRHRRPGEIERAEICGVNADQP